LPKVRSQARRLGFSRNDAQKTMRQPIIVYRWCLAGLRLMRALDPGAADFHLAEE
jgi:hypothetical protein